MEGFVHPTRAQKLAAMRAILLRAYAKDSPTNNILCEELLRRLETAGRGEPHAKEVSP